jgi:hypothetical protein
MTLRLTNKEADRYDGLALLNWPAPPGKEPKPIPPGAKVNVLRRGSLTTDDKGATLAVNGRSPADVMRGSLNLKDHIDIDDWRPLVSQWASSDAWGRRGPLFNEALATYDAGHYAATITLLMPQIEGTIMEYLVRQGKGLQANGRSKKWSSTAREPTVMGDLEDELRARDYGYVRQTIAYTLLDFLRRSTLYSRFTWRDGGEPIGRHPILHGYEVNFGNKANADRLLMVLDSLFWLIGVKSQKGGNGHPLKAGHSCAAMVSGFWSHIL